MREGKMVNFGLKQINQSKIRPYFIEYSPYVQTNHETEEYLLIQVDQSGDKTNEELSRRK